MTSKIEGNRPAVDTEAAKRLEPVRTADRAKTERPVDKGDRVEVSKDAQLMTTALKAASDAPAIRQELVDRMRELLEKGDLGRDSVKLADRMIDDLLNR